MHTPEHYVDRRARKLRVRGRNVALWLIPTVTLFLVALFLGSGFRVYVWPHVTLAVVDLGLIVVWWTFKRRARRLETATLRRRDELFTLNQVRLEDHERSRPVHDVPAPVVPERAESDLDRVWVEREPAPLGSVRPELTTPLVWSADAYEAEEPTPAGVHPL